MTAETLTIGQVADGAGVNIQTLRYYERRGLLPEPPRLHTGHRRYPSEAVAHVRAIKQAQALGFTLGEIEELLLVSQAAKANASVTVQAGIAAKLVQIDEKVESLQAMRQRLARAVEHRCDTLKNCTCAADCPMDETYALPVAAPASPAPETTRAAGGPALKPVRKREVFALTLAVVACMACLLPAALPALLVGGLAIPGIGDFGRDLAVGGLAFAAGGATVYIIARRRMGASVC